MPLAPLLLEGPLEAAPWVNLHSGLTSPWPLHVESLSTMKLLLNTCLLETGQPRCLGWELTRHSRVLFQLFLSLAGYFLSGASAGGYLGLWRERAWGKRTWGVWWCIQQVGGGDKLWSPFRRHKLPGSQVEPGGSL